MNITSTPGYTTKSAPRQFTRQDHFRRTPKMINSRGRTILRDHTKWLEQSGWAASLNKKALPVLISGRALERRFSSAGYLIFVEMTMAKFTLNHLRLDQKTKTLAGRRGQIILNETAYGVIEKIISRPGVVVPVEVLISHVWSNADREPEHADGIIRTTIKNLRGALALLGVGEVHIHSAKNQGYFIEGRRR